MPTAVVTGAAGGIGRAVVERLSSDGFHVVAVDREWPMEGRPDGAVVLDVVDSRRVAEIVGELPRIDAVVNSAAIMSVGLAESLPFDEWDRIANVNVRGAFAVIRAATPALRRSGGAVVNVSSVHARSTSIGAAAYAASKGALSALTRALALELADSGVRVNAVVPGAIETEMLRTGLSRSDDPEASRASLVARTPLGRVGLPADVAHAVSFLVDNLRAGFVTGQELVVDGGVLAKLASE
jgi:NAD(P)-dependent dehydrogenase (short-subunit alcohol dehydrogenase family)